MDEGARFPRVAAKAGHYESFYIKACRAGRRPRDLDPPHRPQAPRRRADRLDLVRPLRPRRRRPAGDQGDRAGGASCRRPAGSWIRVGDAEIGPGEAEGSVDTEALTARLVADLRRRRASPASTCRPTGSTRRRCRGPSSSRPCPDARFEGRLEIDDESIELARLAGDDRPQLGHRARRALGLARGHRLRRRARHLLRRRRRPGQARLADQPLDPLRDADARRRAAPARRPRRDPLRLGSRSRPASARSSSPARTSSSAAASRRRQKDFVGWVYADPKGPEHNTVNCSVADLELTVERPGLPPRQLTLPGGAAYELGMRETDHGIPIQPYPDG